MAWGASSGIRSCDDLLRRLEENDPKLEQMVILPMKNFNADAVHRLAAVLASGVNTHLRTLSASGHDVTPEALEKLGSALAMGKSKLVHLAIGNSNTGDVGVVALCRGLATSESLKLEHVDLSWKGIGPNGMASVVEALGNCKSLKTLILARNEGIGNFDGSTSSDIIFANIEHLDLSGCGLNAKTCQWLASAVSTTTSLELKVNSNPNLGEEATAFLMSLSLREFHASNCNINDTSLQQIVDAYSKTDTLKVLDLSHNHITPQGVQNLAIKLLEGNGFPPSLYDLNLAGNQIGEASTQALAKAFRVMRSQKRLSLSKLDMTDTSCGVKGALDLIRFSQLKSLTLFNNRMKSEGFEILATALRGGHPTLEALDLGGNEADEAGVVALLQPLTCKSDSFENVLRLVVVGGNAGGAAVEAVVEEIERLDPELDIARDKRKQQQSEVGPG